MAKSRVTKIGAAKYGALPGDGKSDAAAVFAAIEDCRKTEAAVLEFAEGQYDFFDADKPDGSNHVFPLKDLENVTIDGGGSTFMFHGYPGAFSFTSCRNVTVRNLTIDYVRPPFSLGRIVAARDKSFDVEVEDRYPITGSEGAAAFLLYDKKNRHPLAAGMEYYGTIPTELVSPSVLRLNAGRDSKLAAGLWVLIRHINYGPGAFVAGGCTDFRLENVTVHTTPGMGFVAGQCTNITVKGFRVVPRPGSGYAMSTTADGMHFSGNKGLISIEDCEFEGMGDDAANIKTGLFSKVTEKVDDRTVLSQHNLKMADAPSPGDTMEIAHMPDVAPYATAVVESVEVLKDGVMKTRFRDTLPKEIEVGDLLGNATRVAKVRIRNVTVRNNRARGFLLQNRDVVVESCHFVNCTSGGIYVLTEVFYFYESIGSRDVVIRNCTFDNCGYWAGPGALAVFGWIGPGSFSTVPGVHRNVVFEGNTIRGTDNSAIFAAGVDGLTIRDNTVEQACRKPHFVLGNTAIGVMGSRNVTLEGNKCEPDKQGEGCKNVFGTGPGCNVYAVKLRNNTGF